MRSFNLAFCRMQDYIVGMSLQNQHTRIALRLKSLREQRKLKQEAFANAMGFKDRQTVAAIEAGERNVSPQELVQAAAVLQVDLDSFLDPYRLIGEGKFSFRAKNVDPTALEAFEEQAGRWIATYRELARRLDVEPSPLGKKLQLSEDSSFEEAAAAAEALWKEWKLGDVPADRLEKAIAQYLSTLVLYVDAPEGISGAASHLPKYDTILVNRKESSGRRFFDLAHELFHILTWDVLPPKRVESWEVEKHKGNRTESLADNFASALLMPSDIMASRWEKRGNEELASWLVRTASELRVSADAVKWRLVTLKLLPKAMAKTLNPAARVVRTPGEQKEPLLFSNRFIELVAKAVDQGFLSLRRAATLLGLSVADFGDLCSAYGYPLSYDLAG